MLIFDNVLLLSIVFVKIVSGKCEKTSLYKPSQRYTESKHGSQFCLSLFLVVNQDQCVFVCLFRHAHMGN